jgi:hypothetical protein
MIVLKQTVLVFSCNFSKIISQLKIGTKAVVIGNFVCVLKYLALKQNIFVVHIANKGAFSLLNTCLQSNTLFLLF